MYDVANKEAEGNGLVIGHHVAEQELQENGAAKGQSHAL